MSLNDIYRKYLSALQNIYSKGETAKITEMIFEYHGGISRSDIIKDPSRKVTEPLLAKLELSLDELLKHKPVQYITGEVWFCNLKLRVSPAVLIPRPETEELVKEVLDHLQSKMSVLDIGTGSGCIPVALKMNKPDIKITAIDTSREALSIAKENSTKYNTDIDLIEIDFLNELSHDNLGNYDIIISNPPYITEAEMNSLDKNVRDYEPHIALFVPDDEAIIFYKKIAAFGKGHMNKNGKIFLETHEANAKAVAAHFINEGYQASVKKDMFEKERMVIANR